MTELTFVPSDPDDDRDGGDVCYLNNAAQAPISPTARMAGWKMLTRPVWSLDSDLDEDKLTVRTCFASLIRADPSDIAITPSTAFAITMAAHNLAQRELRDGGKILVLQNQMCSEVYPWQEVCCSETVSLKVVPHDGDLTIGVLGALEHDSDVRVACLPVLHWSDGSLLDLDRIAEVCRQKHVVLVVDATQSIGMLPFDVTTIRPAMVACSVQKWLGAPPGISLVYVSKEFQPLWQPLDQHGRSRLLKPNWNADPKTMQPDGYPEEYVPNARKFDSGGKGNPIHLAMLAASLEEVMALDMDQAQLWLGQLIEPLLAWATDNHMSVPLHHANHLIGLQPAKMSVAEMLEVCNKLSGDGIFISVRNGVFRISPYLTNSSSDVQRLIDGFERYL